MMKLKEKLCDHVLQNAVKNPIKWSTSPTYGVFLYIKNAQEASHIIGTAWQYTK